ncbi:hypothetical protein MettiDRAFT_1237 [Methanolobus tindarius DSM 2278]|uniref:Uncharacterized protein n=1 Tax=Methanolobus tindarius DSM 2278 TaxID=1090322 RepID=W9DVU7_METTI|nr:winged helix-turn-helix domain-containing protein [Methanolobus tindarius]ETA67802.1 hypothetical protein MettiDRAFT_1237 [Methanolobus tindarius DSM 2278]
MKKNTYILRTLAQHESMTEEHIQIRIMRMLQNQSMRHRDLATETGNRNLYWHLQRLMSFGYIERRKQGKIPYYTITDAGYECLNQDDFSQIRQIQPFVEIATAFMARDDYEPMTARELHGALQDPRPIEQFNSLLAHLIQRKYVKSNKIGRLLTTYELSILGREYASNPAAFRHKKLMTRFH